MYMHLCKHREYTCVRVCTCTHTHTHIYTYIHTYTERLYIWRERDRQRNRNIHRNRNRGRTYTFIFLQIQSESRNTFVTVSISSTHMLISEYTSKKKYYFLEKWLIPRLGKGMHSVSPKILLWVNIRKRSKMMHVTKTQRAACPKGIYTDQI